MALPILTFDERALSPRFGYVFHRRWLWPYESVVSMLWKFARMNGLPGHAVAAHLSPEGVDPCEGCDLSKVDVPCVARLLGLTRRSVCAGIGRAQSDCSPHLRVCPKSINERLDADRLDVDGVCFGVVGAAGRVQAHRSIDPAGESNPMSPGLPHW